MRAEVLTDLGAFEATEAAWWDLFARVPAATPFAAPAWLLPWWRVFAPGELFVVALWLEQRLVGLAPLYRENGPYGRRLLPLGIGLSDTLDILIDPAHSERVEAALSEILRPGRERWDCWSAEEAPPASAVLAMRVPDGWRSDIAPQSSCPVLRPHSPGGLVEAIPSAKRRKWRMAQNRIARRSWALCAATPATVHDDLAHLFRLHGARWQARGETGVLADPLVRRFHAQAAPALMAAGLLRLMVLRIDDAVAGVYYGLRAGNAACAYLGGFDPAFAFESPGTVLIGSAIEAADGEGASSFSFLRGQEAYKYEWGAVDTWNQRRLFTPLR